MGKQTHNNMRNSNSNKKRYVLVETSDPWYDSHAPSTGTASGTLDLEADEEDLHRFPDTYSSEHGPSGVSKQPISEGSTMNRLNPLPVSLNERSGSLAQFADGDIQASPVMAKETVTPTQPTSPINGTSTYLLNPAYACTPRFEKFLEIPLELRGRIYSLVLSNEAPIHPHLCDYPPSGSIKFHDSAQHSRLQPNHGSINKLLGVTLVSQAVRAESLPFFYSSNTFAVDADTPTYFAHLQNLGRFHLIRHVHFPIHMNSEIWTAQYLKQMTTYFKTAEAYECAHNANDENVYEILINHPRYNASGLNEMALMICTRMLASTFASTTTLSTFILPIPSAADFIKYAGLRWFPDVCRGLGIHLSFLESHELEYSGKGVIGVTWHQKFQKKEFGFEGEKGGAELRVRVLEMFPDLQKRIRWDRCSYYRVSCDGNRMGWFEVRT
jgi:hypothetical protein